MLSNFDPFSGNIQLKVSILNTYLRDNYDSLASLCDDLNLNYDNLIEYLNNNNYQYLSNINQITKK